MKLRRNIDLLICLGIALFGVVVTCYLWIFVGGGNHWALFGTATERWLMGCGGYILLLLPFIALVIPFLLKRNKVRFVFALFSMPVFIFISFSLTRFLD